MRIIRTLLIVFSIGAVGVFGISELIEFTNRDTTKPQITAETDTIEVPSEYTREDLMAGIFAWDEKEGDLTDQVVISSLSRFIDKGVCNLTYVVFDASNQSASLTRKVKFTDYHSPRFTLSEPLIFREGEGTYEEVLNRVGAEDVLDGDRKDWMIRTDSDVNFQTQGVYTMTFEVSNSFGDTVSAALPIHVVSAASQSVKISLSANIVYVTAGQGFDPGSYIAGVTASDGSGIDPASVAITSGVDTNTPGCYEVSYQAADALGNYGETWLTVIVEDGGGA